MICYGEAKPARFAMNYVYKNLFEQFISFIAAFYNAVFVSIYPPFLERFSTHFLTHFLTVFTHKNDAVFRH